ncbi:hypothetical protein K6959_12820 [Bacillus aquiflavi]|nr:hypothetical protein K6959_12820 [Bacillus aquiflavi]
MMIYYAVPRISIFSPGLGGYFAIAWITFALFVIAGNLTGILFGTSNVPNKRVKTEKYVKKKIYLHD